MDNLGGMWLEDLGVVWKDKVELTIRFLRFARLNSAYNFRRKT